MRRWTLRIVTLAATLAVLATGAGVAAALMPAPDAQVDGGTLFRSLEQEADSIPDHGAACVHRKGAVWRCDIGDRRGSGAAGYRVTIVGGGPCWTAKLVEDHSEGEMPPSVRGCVRGERWSPLHLLGR